MSKRNDNDGPYRPGRRRGVPFYDPFTGHQLTDGYVSPYVPEYDLYTGQKTPKKDDR